MVLVTGLMGSCKGCGYSEVVRGLGYGELKSRKLWRRL